MTRTSVAVSVCRLILPLVAVPIAACGAEERTSGGDSAGRLEVHKSLADGPAFIEGSVTHLRLTRDDFDVTLDELRPVDTLDVALLDRGMPAGSYLLTAVERPCEGNCDSLDPPVDSTRCEVEVKVSADQTTRVKIVLRRTQASAVSDCSTDQAR